MYRWQEGANLCFCFSGGPGGRRPFSRSPPLDVRRSTSPRSRGSFGRSRSPSPHRLGTKTDIANAASLGALLDKKKKALSKKRHTNDDDVLPVRRPPSPPHPPVIKKTTSDSDVIIISSPRDDEPDARPSSRKSKTKHRPSSGKPAEAAAKPPPQAPPEPVKPHRKPPQVAPAETKPAVVPPSKSLDLGNDQVNVNTNSGRIPDHRTTEYREVPPMEPHVNKDRELSDNHTGKSESSSAPPSRHNTPQRVMPRPATLPYLPLPPVAPEDDGDSDGSSAAPSSRSPFKWVLFKTIFPDIGIPIVHRWVSGRKT